MKRTLKYILIFTFLISALLKIIDLTNSALLFSNILDLTYENAKASLLVLILVELFISVALFKNWYYQKAIFFVCLFVFSLFVILNTTFYIQGVENCGCMGTIIISNPLLSLFKSIIVLVMFVFISFGWRQTADA